LEGVALVKVGQGATNFTHKINAALLIPADPQLQTHYWQFTIKSAFIFFPQALSDFVLRTIKNQIKSSFTYVEFDYIDRSFDWNKNRLRIL